MARRFLRKKEYELDFRKAFGYIEEKVAFQDFVKEYFRVGVTVKAKSTIAREKDSFKNLIAFFGNKYLTSITVKDLEEYRQQRLSTVKKSTVDLELGFLKHLFTKAIDWKYAIENPVKKIKLEKPPSRERYLTVEEIHRLLFCVHQSKSIFIKPIVYIALLTGLRRGDILNLKFEDVNLKDRTITVIQQKTQKKITHYINSVLYPVITSYINKQEKKEGRLFPYTPMGLVSTFKAIVKKAGLKDCSFHTLRHTFCSQMNLLNVDLKTIQEMAGHSRIETTAGYTHILIPHIREASEKLASLFQTNNKTITTKK